MSQRRGLPPNLVCFSCGTRPPALAVRHSSGPLRFSLHCSTECANKAAACVSGRIETVRPAEQRLVLSMKHLHAKDARDGTLVRFWGGLTLFHGLGDRDLNWPTLRPFSPFTNLVTMPIGGDVTENADSNARVFYPRLYEVEVRDSVAVVLMTHNSEGTYKFEDFEELEKKYGSTADNDGYVSSTGEELRLRNEPCRMYDLVGSYYIPAPCIDNKYARRLKFPDRPERGDTERTIKWVRDRSTTKYGWTVESIPFVDDAFNYSLLRQIREDIRAKERYRRIQNLSETPDHIKSNDSLMAGIYYMFVGGNRVQTYVSFADDNSEHYVSVYESVKPHLHPNLGRRVRAFLVTYAHQGVDESGADSAFFVLGGGDMFWPGQDSLYPVASEVWRQAWEFLSTRPRAAVLVPYSIALRLSGEFMLSDGNMIRTHPLPYEVKEGVRNDLFYLNMNVAAVADEDHRTGTHPPRPSYHLPDPGTMAHGNDLFKRPVRRSSETWKVYVPLMRHALLVRSVEDLRYLIGRILYWEEEDLDERHEYLHSMVATVLSDVNMKEAEDGEIDWILSPEFGELLKVRNTLICVDPTLKPGTRVGAPDSESAKSLAKSMAMQLINQPFENGLLNGKLILSRFAKLIAFVAERDRDGEPVRTIPLMFAATFALNIRDWRVFEKREFAPDFSEPLSGLSVSLPRELTTEVIVAFARLLTHERARTPLWTPTKHSFVDLFQKTNIDNSGEEIVRAAVLQLVDDELTDDKVFGEFVEAAYAGALERRKWPILWGTRLLDELESGRPRRLAQLVIAARLFMAANAPMKDRADPEARDVETMAAASGHSKAVATALFENTHPEGIVYWLKSRKITPEQAFILILPFLGHARSDSFITADEAEKIARESLDEEGARRALRMSRLTDVKHDAYRESHVRLAVRLLMPFEWREAFDKARETAPKNLSDMEQRMREGRLGLSLLTPTKRANDRGPDDGQHTAPRKRANDREPDDGQYTAKSRAVSEVQDMQKKLLP